MEKMHELGRQSRRGGREGGREGGRTDGGDCTELDRGG